MLLNNLLQRLRGLCPSVVISICLTSIGGFAVAQQGPDMLPISVNVPYEFDSGWYENEQSMPEVVLSFPVFLENAEWMRLYFEEVTLSGDLAKGTGSILRLTALEDGSTQELNARHMSEWQNSSAYFNGNTVLVEVLAHPNSGWNHVTMRSIDMGIIPIEEPSICGFTDDRVLSSDPRVSRVMPVGCTGWLIDDCGRCFLTAGHCTGNISVAQFNVPLSNSNGSFNHPPATDQYAVDGSSMQVSSNIQIGNDWAHFGAFANSNTGMTPAQAQGSVFALVTPPPTNGTDIRITGHGVDGGTRNGVQQTHVGPAADMAGNAISYVTDTRGGNSGSPVIWEQTNQAVGIHTNAGCGQTGGANNGTSSINSSLQAAISNAQGICGSGLSFPGSFPELVPPGVPLVFQAQLIAGGSSVTLHYRLNGGAFLTQAMTNLGGDLYEGAIPAPACTDSPEYYFSYQDSSCGGVSFPDDAPSSFLSTDVGVVEVSFVDDFQSDTGWTTTVNGASSGAWERGMPINDPNWPYDPAADSDGSGSCYLTENQLGDTDVDGGSVSLISPVIDLSTPGTFVSYDYFYRLTTGIGNDSFRVEARNGAGPWSTVVNHVNNGGLNWRTKMLDSENFTDAGILLRGDVQMRFTVNDVGSANVNEGGLDNFFVGRVSCNGGLGQNYCSSGANGAIIYADGSASVTDNDVTLTAANLPASVNGLFFYGNAQNNVPLGNGTLCVTGLTGIFRLAPVLNSGPAGEVSIQLDLTAPPQPAGQVVPGSIWNYQFWFRDGGTSDLTDGLTITYQP